jgi:hypothetical protein
MSVSRNFDCPLTGEPCVDGACKRNLCIKSELAKAKTIPDETPRERRIRTGQVRPEDLGF